MEHRIRQLLESKYIGLVPYLLLCFILSAYAIIVFFIGSDFGGQRQGHSFQKMILGGSRPPTGYRVLMGNTIYSFIIMAPDWLLAAINDICLEIRDSKVFNMILHKRRDSMPPSLRDNALVYLDFLFVLLTWIFAMIYMAAMYCLAKLLEPKQPLFALLAPIIAIVLMPVIHKNFAYAYDYGVVMFMALCCIAMLKRQWLLYGFLLFLAFLNKETSLYIIFIYAVYFWSRMPYKTYLVSIGGQLVAYAIVYVTIRYLVGFNHLSDGLFSSTKRIFTLSLDAYNAPTLMAWLLGLFFILYQWPQKPLLLRRSVWLLAPLTAAYLLVGFPREYRQFADFFPFLALFYSHSLITAMGIAKPGDLVIEGQPHSTKTTL